MAQLLLDILACFVSIAILTYIRHYQKKTLPTPPGPKGYPIIGNLLDMSANGMWVKFHKWSKELESDIIHVNLAGKSLIVLSSLETVMDLLERRSSIYSDRPRSPMLLELMGFDFNFVMLPYGHQWRSQRKLMHQVFHPAAAKNFRPHTLKAARSVLRRFLDKPKDVVGNVRHMAGETIMSIAYGLEVEADNDPYIATSEKTARLLSEVVSLGGNFVDIFPILKYVPKWVPTTFHAKAREARHLAHQLLELPFQAAKKSIDSRNFSPSFVSYCYSLTAGTIPQDPAWQEYLIKGTAAVMYLAGSDTTSSTINYCIAYLLNHPEILQRAQAEIDSIVPFGELPSFEDEDKLPFIISICKETMRMKELLPLSVPHLLMEDDVYKGYRLPKGSIIVTNAWAMLHNEAVYPDPHSFKPDRFMKDGKINKDVRDPSQIAFGFGRRICPGRFMAFPAVWITVASIIAAFDITQVTDAEGFAIKADLSDDDGDGIGRFPKPFMCTLRPRSTKHEQTIRATLDEEY